MNTPAKKSVKAAAAAHAAANAPKVPPSPVAAAAAQAVKETPEPMVQMPARVLHAVCEFIATHKGVTYAEAAPVMGLIQNSARPVQ